MEIVQSSLVLRYVLLLWEGSLLRRLIVRADAALSRWAGGSFLCALFRRDGVFLRSYPHSLICRAVSALAGLPPALARLVLRPIPRFAEGSLLYRILRPELGSTVISYLSWVLLLLLSVPHELWNNTYSLLLAIGGLALFWLGSVSAPRRGLRMDAMGPWWLGFACSLALAFLISFDRGTSFRYLCFHLTGLLLAVVLVSAAETAGDLLRMAGFCTAGMAVASLYGLYQSWVGVEVDELLVDVRFNEDLPGRIDSFFENPNTLAQILVMLIPLGVGLVFASRSKWGRLAALAASGLGVAAILLTYSRGSWLGLAAAAVVFVALFRRRLLPLFALAAAACVPLLPESILSRILSSFNFKDTSISSRFPIYSASVQSILRSPVLGVGLGSELVWESFERGGFYEGTLTFVHLHNIFLQLWVECGLFGVLTFAGFSLSALKESARAAAGPLAASPLKPLLIGCAAALAGSLVCGLTDYIWYYPRAICVFWTLLGILLAGVRLAREGERA